MSNLKLYTVYGSLTKAFQVEVESDNPDAVRELAYDKAKRDYGYFDDWEVEEIIEEGE